MFYRIVTIVGLALACLAPLHAHAQQEAVPSCWEMEDQTNSAPFGGSGFYSPVGDVVYVLRDEENCRLNGLELRQIPARFCFFENTVYTAPRAEHLTLRAMFEETVRDQPGAHVLVQVVRLMRPWDMCATFWFSYVTQ